MAREVWKFPLGTEQDPVELRQEIEMPRGAQLLEVQTQFGLPVLWALVDPEVERETRTFWTYGTGHRAERTRVYVGTFQLAEGRFIGHVFEA